MAQTLETLDPETSMVRCIQSIFGSTDFFRIQTHELTFGERHLFLDRLIWASLYLGEFISGSVFTSAEWVNLYPEVYLRLQMGELIFGKGFALTELFIFYLGFFRESQ